MSRLKRLKDASLTATLFDRQYSSNTANQISQIAEPTLTRNFGYDNVDRLTSMANGAAGESYVFDGVGNRTASHRSSTYGYQPFNKIASTQTATYGSDADGNMTTKSEAGVNWTYGWDFENKMSSAGNGTASVSYQYDALGRRVKRTQGASVEKYTHDRQDVILDDIGGTLTKYQNALSMDNKLKSTTGTTVNYFLADHLGSTNGLSNSTGTVTASNSYNANGSITGKTSGATSWAYEWDRENRLVKATSTTSQVARYKYDALGRRVTRQTEVPVPLMPPAVDTANFVYEGEDVIQDKNALGVVTASYINGPGIDNKLRQTTGSGLTAVTNYYLGDHLGSTNALSNTLATNTQTNGYDSFGNASNSNFTSRYQFTGREYDSLTGLQFSRARFYDPQIGRFISEDPIGFGGEDVNLYGYVWNNPQNWFDPFGLDGFKLPESPGPNGENLPKGWRPDPSHKYPNGERWVSPNGDEGLDFDRGRPGKPGFGGKDGWHKLKPGRNGGLERDKQGGRKGGHYLPGDEVELNNPQFCPARIPNLSQPTPEEIRLQIDAANNMEAFWTKILLGSAAAGGGYLVPGLIPALIPALPGLAPQFAH